MDADGGDAGRMLSLLYTIASAGVDNAPARVRPGCAPTLPGSRVQDLLLPRRYDHCHCSGRERLALWPVASPLGKQALAL